MSGDNSKPYSLTHIANMGFIPEIQTPFVLGASFDGTNVSLDPSKQVAKKVTTVGSVYYVAIAPPGTAQSAAKWQAQKIDTTTDVIITWADGNANFDNIATDLTALSYS